MHIVTQIIKEQFVVIIIILKQLPYFSFRSNCNFQPPSFKKFFTACANKCIHVFSMLHHCMKVTYLFCVFVFFWCKYWLYCLKVPIKLVCALTLCMCTMCACIYTTYIVQDFVSTIQIQRKMRTINL